MKLRSLLLVAGLSICFFLLLACGSARRGEPLTGRSSFSEEAGLGRIAFYAHCDQCHPGGEAGLGPALNNKPLPGFLIKMQIRHGLGAMPSFSNIRVPERDMDNIVNYLKELRR